MSDINNTTTTKKKIDVDEINRKYKKRSQLAEVWIRLKRNKAAVCGMVIFLVILLISIFANQIYDYETMALAQDPVNRLAKPSAEHLLGLDEFGRDIAARIVHGSRLSLRVGVIAVSVSLFFGGTLGAVAGYFGGKLDAVIMRFMDILLAVPGILMAIVIMSILGNSAFNLMLAIGIYSAPSYARIVRSAVLTVKDQEYIEVARALGAKNATIIFREVLPNCLAPIIVQVTLNVATAILSTSTMSFIGLGINPPTPEWGNMLSGGRAFLRDAPHLCIFPGLAIVITILSLNLFGDGLRDALDPKLKQ